MGAYRRFGSYYYSPLIKCKPRPTFLTMRHESAWIYYMHMYVLMLLSLVIFTNGASKGIIISCAFVISFALAWLLTKLQKRSRMFSYLVSWFSTPIQENNSPPFILWNCFGDYNVLTIIKQEYRVKDKIEQNRRESKTLSSAYSLVILLKLSHHDFAYGSIRIAHDVDSRSNRFMSITLQIVNRNNHNVSFSAFHAILSDSEPYFPGAAV